MSAAKRVLLSAEVQHEVAQSEDINETFWLLEAAALVYERTQQPVTLQEVREEMRHTGRTCT